MADTQEFSRLRSRLLILYWLEHLLVHLFVHQIGAEGTVFHARYDLLPESQRKPFIRTLLGDQPVCLKVLCAGCMPRALVSCWLLWHICSNVFVRMYRIWTSEHSNASSRSSGTVENELSPRRLSNGYRCAQCSLLPKVCVVAGP